LEHLNEDTIKRATLTFMKTYYKFRPRAGETSISYDMIHPSGVIVDGYLTFLREDGKPFIATFEATSAISAAEVRFRLQQKQLVWDAIAVGSCLATLLMAAAWITNMWDLTRVGWLFSLVLPLVLAFLSVIAYQMLFRTSERYRYIYAIEQFKQYHADEQWVALGKDVFDNTSESDFAELRDQCVKNGFGLVTVDGDEHVNLLITPAREEIFGKKRHTLKFAETPSVSNGVSDIKRLSPQNLERFQQPFFRQLAVSLCSVVMLSGLFYRSWTLRPVDYVSNEKSYQDSLVRRALNMSAEPAAMVYNQEDVEKIIPTPQPYAPTVTTTSNPPKAEATVGLYVYTLSDGYLTYDCARIDMRGTKYIVQDHVYVSFDEARRRIDQLKTQDLTGNAICLTCTTNATTRGYCVYYGDFFNDVNAANQKANDIKKELAAMGLANEFIQIRVLQF
jgi:hypothetical protein